MHTSEPADPAPDALAARPELPPSWCPGTGAAGALTMGRAAAAIACSSETPFPSPCSLSAISKSRSASASTLILEEVVVTVLLSLVP